MQALRRASRAPPGLGRWVRRWHQGAAIAQNEDGVLEVPDFPIIPFIMGDGSGTEMWHATRHVLDEAVFQAYGGEKAIQWLEVYAGTKSTKQHGKWLPPDTVEAFRRYRIGMKGPLFAPKSESSVTVSLRQALDLYCNVRPIWYIEGVPSPMRRPHLLNVTIFREATEDVYNNIEFSSGSPEAKNFHQFLGCHGMDVTPFEIDSTAFTLKTASQEGTERLVEAAIQFGLAHHKRNVMLVHKATIMKVTEGLFAEVAYQVVKERFRDECVTERESVILGNHEGGLTNYADNARELEPGFQYMSQDRQQRVVAEVQEVVEGLSSSHGQGRWKAKLLVKDGLISTVLQQVMMRPGEFDVLVTPNFYGSILSSWLLAQVGGAGMSPSGSYNFQTGHAVFEASYGPAPRYAGRDLANPSGQLLAGSMMLQQLGWTEAAAMVAHAVQTTIVSKAVPFELNLLSKDAPKGLPCSEFGRAVAAHLRPNERPV